MHCKLITDMFFMNKNINQQENLVLVMHCFAILVVPGLFEEKRRDIVFGFPSFRPPKVLCTLCAQLLLQFSADSFETLQMFLSWSEDIANCRPVETAVILSSP